LVSPPWTRPGWRRHADAGSARRAGWRKCAPGPTRWQGSPKTSVPSGERTTSTRSSRGWSRNGREATVAIESRAAWGARKPRSVSYVSKTKGVKAHYTGGHVNPATLTDHAKCRAAIRGIQNGHMDGNGWADIAYSMWVCNHTAGMG